MESAMRQITQFLELINLMGVKKKMVGEGTGTYRLRDLRNRDFPGSPVVKNLPSTTEDMGLIPGQGTKIPTCYGAAKPVYSRAHMLQLESPYPTTWEKPASHSKEPEQCNKRSLMPQLRFNVAQNK